MARTKTVEELQAEQERIENELKIKTQKLKALKLQQQEQLRKVFFASANSQKLQAKMEKFASPFWRKLQAVRHSIAAAALQTCY